MGNQRESTTEDWFGIRMRASRVQRGWSQEHLAERMAEHGVRLHGSAVAKMEHRDADRPRAIRLNEAAAAAAALGDRLDKMTMPGGYEELAEEAERLVRLGRLQNKDVQVFLQRLHELPLLLSDTDNSDKHQEAAQTRIINALARMESDERERQQAAKNVLERLTEGDEPSDE